MDNLFFSPKEMLHDILKQTDYTLTQVSEETGISRTTLTRIYHNCGGVTHMRNFNKLLRMYCRVITKNSAERKEC